MIDHTDDIIEEEDETEVNETDLVAQDSVTVPSIVITPSAKKTEDILYKDEVDPIKPPLAEPESLALPSVVISPTFEKELSSNDKDDIDSDAEDVSSDKVLVLEHNNRRIIAMLFKSLPFCSDTSVIE